MDPNANSPAPESSTSPETPAPPPPSESSTPPPAFSSAEPQPGSTPQATDSNTPQSDFPESPTEPVPPMTPGSTYGPVVGSDVDAQIAGAQPVVTSGGSGKRKLLAIVTVLVVLLGGAAAAYFGVVVPNKPENVLSAAIQNSLQQQQVNFKGRMNVDPISSEDGPAVKLDFTGSSDAGAKAVAMELKATVSGVTFPVETRLVDKNLYFKLGDLSTLSSLAATYSPEAGDLAKSLSSKLSNKWVEVDSTLLKQAGGSCVLDSNWALSRADVDILTTTYKKHKFTTIKSNTADVVNGHKAQKFELSIDDDRVAAYARDKSLDQLSLIKSLQKCQKDNSAESELKGDHQQTPLTVWVDKSTKRISRISLESTDKHAKEAGDKVSLTVDTSYGKVSISAPKGAEPVMQLIAELQSTLGGSSEDGLDLLSMFSSSSSQGNAKDSKRQSDMSALQTQLEAYYAEQGNYPSLSEFNSASWRKDNMPDLDENALQDPDGSSKTLVAKPAAKAYAYQVTDSGGHSCEAVATNCAKYTLTATLSDGKTATKTNLE